MRSSLLALTFLLLLAACNSGPSSSLPLATVSTTTSGARMPAAGGFAWLPRSGIAPDPRLEGQDVAGMVRRAITEELAARGLRPSAPGRASVLVAFTGAVTGPLDDQGLDSTYRLAGTGDDRGEPRTYDQGSLVVDVIDARTQRGLWRGAVQGTIDFDLTPRQRNERVRAAVQSLLATLPRTR